MKRPNISKVDQPLEEEKSASIFPFVFTILKEKEEPSKILEIWSWVNLKRPGISPSARSYHSCVNIGPNLYFFGGFDGTARKNDFFCFNTGIFIVNIRINRFAGMETNFDK